MVFAAEGDFRVSAPKRASFANAASEFDVGHEVELGRDDAFALALLTPAALELKLKGRALKSR